MKLHTMALAALVSIGLSALAAPAAAITKDGADPHWSAGKPQASLGVDAIKPGCDNYKGCGPSDMGQRSSARPVKCHKQPDGRK